MTNHSYVFYLNTENLQRKEMSLEDNDKPPEKANSPFCKQNSHSVTVQCQPKTYVVECLPLLSLK